MKQSEWKNLGVAEVAYGFGWTIEGDPSTQTIINVLDKLDDKFKKLKEENEQLKIQSKLQVGDRVLLKECSVEEYGVYSPEEKGIVLEINGEMLVVEVAHPEFDDGLRECTIDQVKTILN